MTASLNQDDFWPGSCQHICICKSHDFSTSDLRSSGRHCFKNTVCAVAGVCVLFFVIVFGVAFCLQIIESWNLSANYFLSKLLSSMPMVWIYLRSDEPSRKKLAPVNCVKEDDLRQIVNILVAAVKSCDSVAASTCLTYGEQTLLHETLLLIPINPIFLQVEFRVCLCNRKGLSKYSFIMFDYFLCINFKENGSKISSF